MNQILDVAQFISNPKENIQKFISIRDLVRTVENNDWHLSQSVLDHTMDVFNSVDRIISLDDPLMRYVEPIRQEILEYMDTPVRSNSRRLLLKIAALLHDLGKVSTIQIKSDGKTTCPGHALESKRLFEQKAELLSAPQIEVAYIANIIGKHHDADAFMDALELDKYADELARYRSGNKDTVVDLLFFYIFDFEGCKINSNIRDQKPSMYKKVCNIIFDEFKR